MFSAHVRLTYKTILLHPPIVGVFTDVSLSKNPSAAGQVVMKNKGTSDFQRSGAFVLDVGETPTLGVIGDHIITARITRCCLKTELRNAIALVTMQK